MRSKRQEMNTEGKAGGLDRKKVMDYLLEKHRSYFDIFTAEEGEESVAGESTATGEKSSDEKSAAGYLFAHGDFHVHSSKYVLVKKAKLWEADCNEFVFFFSVDHLTEFILNQCIKLAYDEGMLKIEPKSGHMYSFITALFVCDDCDPQALKKLKKCRIHKEFNFSLHGWMDFHTGIIKCDNGTTAVNKSGKAKKKLLDDIVTYVTKD